MNKIQNLNSTYILNLNKKKIYISNKIQKKIIHLKQKYKTKLNIPNIKQLKISKNITIYFQNYKSLQKHIKNIQKNKYITKTNILKLYKTQILQNKKLYNLNIYNSFFISKKYPHNITIYIKYNISQIII